MKHLLHMNQYASSVEDEDGSWVLLDKRTKQGGKAKVTDSGHELAKKVTTMSKEECDATCRRRSMRPMRSDPLNPTLHSHHCPHGPCRVGRAPTHPQQPPATAQSRGRPR